MGLFLNSEHSNLINDNKVKKKFDLRPIYIKDAKTQKNAGLNTTKCWVKYGQTQQLGCFDPAVGLNILAWNKHEWRWEGILFQPQKDVNTLFFYTLINAGLNTTQRWVKYGRTQQLGCLDPAVGLLPRSLG